MTSYKEKFSGKSVTIRMDLFLLTESTKTEGIAMTDLSNKTYRNMFAEIGIDRKSVV